MYTGRLLCIAIVIPSTRDDAIGTIVAAAAFIYQVRSASAEPDLDSVLLTVRGSWQRKRETWVEIENARCDGRSLEYRGDTSLVVYLLCHHGSQLLASPLAEGLSYSYDCPGRITSFCMDIRSGGGWGQSLITMYTCAQARKLRGN